MWMPYIYFLGECHLAVNTFHSEVGEQLIKWSHSTRIEHRSLEHSQGSPISDYVTNRAEEDVLVSCFRATHN